MKEQVEEILSKPEITYEAGDGSLQQESSLTLRQIEEVASELCQFFEKELEQAKEEGAREIFEEIEKLLDLLLLGDFSIDANSLETFTQEWQALKSEHLKG